MRLGGSRARAAATLLALATLASLLGAGCSSGPVASVGAGAEPSSSGAGASPDTGTSPGAGASPGSATGDPTAEPSGADPSAPPADVAAAATVIESADPDRPDSVGALQGIRFTDAGAQAARAAIEAGATGDALWAATWVYASSGDDPAPLEPLQAAEDESIRVMAGAAVAWMGGVDGFDTLVAALGSTGYLRGSEPPLTIAAYADGSLRYLTGAAPGPDGWPAWLAANRAGLDYDPEERTWTPR
jgi:hypothetical protein